MALHTISLCSGGAGLDIGLELATPGARSVCYVEREAFCIARLVEAMQEGFLADAPVWTDVSTFRGRPWRGLVDGVIGGIPCQPHSYAGQRKGADDERDLWPDMRRIINEARPWFVWVENVAGMLVGPEGQVAGAARVRRDLAAMSFRSEVVLVRASEVGASHERARVFILSLADDSGERWGSRRAEPVVRLGRHSLGGQGCSGVGLADPISRGHDGRSRDEGRGSIGRTAAEGAGAGIVGVGLANTDIAQLCGQPPAGQLAQPQPDDGISLFPPGPGDRAAWGHIAATRPDLLPATAQSRIRCVADGLASRVDQLRMLGNGVVPLQAAHAWRLLVAQHNRFSALPAAQHLHGLMNQ